MFFPPSVADTGNPLNVTVQLFLLFNSFTLPVAVPSLYSSTLILSTGAFILLPFDPFQSIVTLTSLVGGIIGVHGFSGVSTSFLSVTVNLFPFVFTSFPFAFLTVTFPCSSTSKVISVTFKYPLGATSSWNI